MQYKEFRVKLNMKRMARNPSLVFNRLSESNVLFLARKSCNVFVCVYVELFPRKVCNC